jgi:type III secretory pathway component EscT
MSRFRCDQQDDGDCNYKLLVGGLIMNVLRIGALAIGFLLSTPVWAAQHEITVDAQIQ